MGAMKPCERGTWSRLKTRESIQVYKVGTLPCKKPSKAVLPIVRYINVMTTTRNPPFRAEHLGSLLRPENLLTVRADFEAKKNTEKELRPAEDDAIKEIVNVQVDLGLRAISDGEYRYVQPVAFTVRFIHPFQPWRFLGLVLPRARGV